MFSSMLGSQSALIPDSTKRPIMTSQSLFKDEQTPGAGTFPLKMLYDSIHGFIGKKPSKHPFRSSLFCNLENENL